MAEETGQSEAAGGVGSLVAAVSGCRTCSCTKLTCNTLVTCDLSLLVPWHSDASPIDFHTKPIELKLSL